MITMLNDFPQGSIKYSTLLIFGQTVETRGANPEASTRYNMVGLALIHKR